MEELPVCYSSKKAGAEVVSGLSLVEQNHVHFQYTEDLGKNLWKQHCNAKKCTCTRLHREIGWGCNRSVSFSPFGFAAGLVRGVNCVCRGRWSIQIIPQDKPTFCGFCPMPVRSTIKFYFRFALDSRHAPVKVILRKSLSTQKVKVFLSKTSTLTKTIAS